MRLRHARHAALPGVAFFMAFSALAQDRRAPDAIDSGASTADAKSRAIFDQAFSKRKPPAAQRLSLPTVLDEREIGTLDAEMGAQGVRMARKPLAEALRSTLRSDLHARLADAAGGEWISLKELADLGIEASYSAQRIALDLALPLALRARQTLRLNARDGGEPRPGSVLTPERWSLIGNARWVASQQSNAGESVVRSRLFSEAAARLDDWVLEGKGSVATDGTGGGFERYATRLVRDWPDAAVRLELGDVAGSARAGLAPLSLGGLRLARRFELNPGASMQALPAQTVGLPAGAAVDVVVNGFVVRSLRLAPGVYNLRDIPVSDGANDVLLRIVEPGGRVTEQRIDYFFDATLLAPGLSEWDVALGAPVRLGTGSLRYAGSTPAASAWWRRGWSQSFTAGTGLQWLKKPEGAASVLQTEAVWALPVGTLAGWWARSSQPWGAGQAASLQWRLGTTPTPNAPFSASLAAQVLRSGAGFAGVESSTAGIASTDTGLRAGLVWGAGWGATLSLAQRGSPLASVRSASQGASLRRRIDRHWSVELVASRTRSEPAARTTSASVLLRYSGEPDPGGTTGRAAVGWQSQDQRLQTDAALSGITTVAGGDAPWHLSGGRIDGRSGSQTSLLGQLFTGRGDVSWNTTRTQQAAGASNFNELTLASALVISRAGLRVAAPVADSAAVLVPRPALQGLKLLVDPQQSRVAASSDWLGAPVLSDLMAYNPREIQLDAENLPPGSSLGEDRPRLTPAYRSVLLVPVGSDANTQVAGRLQDTRQQALALHALRITPQGQDAPVEVFTNRRGEFMSPPLPPGAYTLRAPGEATALARFEIAADQSGVLSIGPVTWNKETP